MSFELLCATMIGLLFGAIICFGGYRFFLILLPFWGFFFGFGLGAQTVQALLGDAFFATVTSWVVGFVLAVAFAVLSYLFYIVAVALIAGLAGLRTGRGHHGSHRLQLRPDHVGVGHRGRRHFCLGYDPVQPGQVCHHHCHGAGRCRVGHRHTWCWASTVYRRQRPRQIRSARCCRGHRCWRSSLLSWQRRARMCSGFRAASTRWWRTIIEFRPTVPRASQAPYGAVAVS